MPQRDQAPEVTEIGGFHMPMGKVCGAPGTELARGAGGTRSVEANRDHVLKVNARFFDSYLETVSRSAGGTFRALASQTRFGINPPVERTIRDRKCKSLGRQFEPRQLSSHLRRFS
jgi:hypothetical protein